MIVLRNLLILLALGFFQPSFLSAQDQPPPRRGRDAAGPASERVSQARQAFLTQEMELTEEEADAFFPLFWERDQELRELGRELRDARRRFRDQDEPSEDDALRRLNMVSDLQSRKMEIENRYQALFLEVIPPSKLLLLEPAERAFRARLLDRVRERRQRRRRN